MNTEEKLKSKEGDVDVKPPSPTQPDGDQWVPLPATNLPRPFDIICNDLMALGALSIDDFLNNAPTSSSAVSAVNFDINFHLQIPELAPVSPEKDKDKDKASGKGPDDAEDAKNEKVLRNAVALLRQTCQSVFGSSEALNYEYLEGDPKSMSFLFSPRQKFFYAIYLIPDPYFSSYR